MNHAGSVSGSRASKVFDGIGIDFFAKFGIVFRFVYLSIGGTVDDIVDVVVGYGLFYGFGIADVQFGDIGKDTFKTVVPIQCVPHFMSQLSVSARNKNFLSHRILCFIPVPIHRLFPVCIFRRESKGKSISVESLSVCRIGFLFSAIAVTILRTTH